MSICCCFQAGTEEEEADEAEEEEVIEAESVFGFLATSGEVMPQLVVGDLRGAGLEAAGASPPGFDATAGFLAAGGSLVGTGGSGDPKGRVADLGFVTISSVEEGVGGGDIAFGGAVGFVAMPGLEAGAGFAAAGEAAASGFEDTSGLADFGGGGSFFAGAAAAGGGEATAGFEAIAGLSGGVDSTGEVGAYLEEMMSN